MKKRSICNCIKKRENEWVGYVLKYGKLLGLIIEDHVKEKTVKIDLRVLPTNCERPRIHFVRRNKKRGE